MNLNITAARERTLRIGFTYVGSRFFMSARYRLRLLSGFCNLKVKY